MDLVQLGRQEGTQLQSLLEVTFLFNLLCSNTILSKLPECSALGNTRMGCMDIRESAHTGNNFVAVAVVVAPCKWAFTMSEIKCEIDITH